MVSLKFWKHKEKVYEHKNTRLVVTGTCSANDKKALEEDLKKKGVNAVVTTNPVLGVFDI